MSDAAPHYLTDEVWASILSKRTDEEIVEVAGRRWPHAQDSAPD